MKRETHTMSVETEGARRATGVSTDNATHSGHFPDPEVPEKAIRRKFTAKHKLHILREVDRGTTQGQIGALLRREGLSTHLTLPRGVVNANQGTLGSSFSKTSRPKSKEYRSFRSSYC